MATRDPHRGEVLFPTWLLLEALAEFARERPETRVEIYETVLEGTGEMLAEGRVDFAIGSMPAGVEGKPIGSVRFIMVANPAIPCTSSAVRSPSATCGAIGASSSATRARARARGRGRGAALDREQQGDLDPRAHDGLGFAWMPEDTIRAELAGRDRSSKLPLRDAGERMVQVSWRSRTPISPGATSARLAESSSARMRGKCDKDRAIRLRSASEAPRRAP
jgi:DNA-binding transcriptional LysR family regulator